MKKAHVLILICSITGFGAYAAVQLPGGVALRYADAAEAFTLIKQQLGADATGAVSSVNEKLNLIALDAAHAQAPIVRAFLTGLDNPPPEIRVDATVTQKSSATSSAEEVGTTGMWINERKNPDEPLRTGLVWTNSPAEKIGIKPGLFLIAVNGTNVVSKPTTQVLSMVRGPVGAIVTLELADAALTKTNKLTVKRGRAVIRNNQIIEITE